MKWEIVIVDGPDAGRRFLIPHDRPFLIGRGSASDTRINLPELSRVHCEIRWNKDSLLLSDCGSQQGTICHGQRLTEPCRVAHGDQIQIGPIRLRIESDNPLDAATISGSLPSSVTHKEKTPLREPGINRATDVHEDFIGSEIHGYRIESLVVQGHSGKIYRAIRLEDERTVAFKVLHPYLASSEEQRNRFVRAMRTMLPVRHPHIVRVLNAGKRGNLCWSTMEWIDGISAALLIERIGTGGAMDWEDVWRVAIHMTRALEEAHRLHLIHRNITPTNVLRRDQDKAFLLSDLCLAKAIDESGATELTQPGTLLGELPFTAPERLLRPNSIDHRADQYGLGCTLYALLAGAPPHRRMDLTQMLQAWKTGEVVPVRFRRPGIYEPFEDIVLKMLRVDPNNRFAHPSELLRSLKEVGRRRGLDADWFVSM